MYHEFYYMEADLSSDVPFLDQDRSSDEVKVNFFTIRRNYNLPEEGVDFGRMPDVLTGGGTTLGIVVSDKMKTLIAPIRLPKHEWVDVFVTHKNKRYDYHFLHIYDNILAIADLQKSTFWIKKPGTEAQIIKINDMKDFYEKVSGSFLTINELFLDKAYLENSYDVVKYFHSDALVITSDTKKMFENAQLEGIVYKKINIVANYNG